ncbi:MAG: undecaprenyl/decaprenyl-phosphate alpha-N-acetylglucosaminyl 1-phosphate transferase, partial [Actinobacteria bacterium]|nr:undecaprenyl/decaprenyl-phosphate alpha-N-acetylglucosaminyl 1-phosphate transferase [Actinomycetota bacterium]
MREYMLCLFAAAAVTYFLTPPVRALAIRWGIIAPVRDRDVHDTPTPRLGGLAMAGGLLAGLLLASKLPMMSAVFDGSTTIVALLSGAAIIVMLGIVDDKWGLDAPTKLAGQVLAAGVMAFQGVAIIWLPIGGTFVLDPLTSVLLTVIVVVVSINAINFVDGLDGLAAGIVAVAAGAFFVYAYVLSVELGLQRATLATLVSVVLVGMGLGFLPNNLFPARIFMGDTGSMLLGLLLAAATITLSGQVDPSALSSGVFLPTLLPLILPFAVMALPLVDLVLAVIRRTRAGRNPFAPDKRHLHHRLLEMGHSQRRAVSLMYAWTALIAGAALAVAFFPLIYAGVGTAIGVLIVVFLVTRTSAVS